MKIFIIDIIGKHSGMHYYDRSFKKVLQKKYRSVEVISNYTESQGEKAILCNYYRGNIFAQIGGLIKSLIKYYSYILKNSKNCFIFLSYGNAYEILFTWPLKLCTKNLIDIHEVISLDSDPKFVLLIRKLYSWMLYRHIADGVIIHSARSASLLDTIGYSGRRFEIPHFSYDQSIDFNETEISQEVRSLISLSRINILFFGHIRSSKGVEYIIDLARMASSPDSSFLFNFIVAGNDPDSLINTILKKAPVTGKNCLSVLSRYVTDDEMRYLFTMTDCVILPYKKISQSGVLEMAVGFRKPVITSSLDYFREFLDRFPTFGIYCENDYVKEYYNILSERFSDRSALKRMFYSDSDTDKYNRYKDPVDFLEELGKVIIVE